MVNIKGNILMSVSFYVSLQQWFYGGIFKLDLFDVIIKIGSIIIMIMTIIYLYRQSKCKQLEINKTNLEIDEIIEKHPELPHVKDCIE
jgi:hypothetical protein